MLVQDQRTQEDPMDIAQFMPFRVSACNGAPEASVKERDCDSSSGTKRSSLLIVSVLIAGDQVDM